MVWLHRLAVLVSAATAVLILFGGLVTNTGAALAVPDWPTTFGQNMFFYPWSQMTGGVFYEHSHRLVGSIVGFLTVLLAVLLWITEPRGWLRRLGLLAVVFVVAQGLVGGLRVVLLAENLAILHGVLAQAFFGLTLCLVLFTSKEWTEGARTRGEAVPTAQRRLALWTTCALFLQIVFGAFLTHWGRLDAHLAWSLVLIILVPLFGIQVMRKHPENPSLLGLAMGMEALFVIQLLLGTGSYAVRFTSLAFPLAPVTTILLPVAHRLTAALLFGLSLVITLKLYRLGASREGSPATLPVGMKGLPV